MANTIVVGDADENHCYVPVSLHIDHPAQNHCKPREHRNQWPLMIIEWILYYYSTINWFLLILFYYTILLMERSHDTPLVLCKTANGSSCGRNLHLKALITWNWYAYGAQVITSLDISSQVLVLLGWVTLTRTAGLNGCVTTTIRRSHSIGNTSTFVSVPWW